LPCLRTWPKKEHDRQLDWTGCTGDMRGVFAPYVAMEKSKAEFLAKNPNALGLNMALLVEALDGIDPSIDGAALRHRSERTSRRDALRLLMTALGKLLGIETTRLAVERQRLDSENVALAQLFALVQKLQAEITTLEAKKAALAARIAAARTMQATLRLQAETLTARGEQLQEAIALSTEAAANVQLNCGGKTYDDCPDLAARRDYDRRVYEAHEKTSKLLQELFTTSDALATTYSDLFAAQQDEILATVDATTTGFDLATTQVEWQNRSQEYQKRNAQYVADEAIWKSRQADHARDVVTHTDVMTEIDAKLPTP
jgi:hypothetical protein